MEKNIKFIILLITTCAFFLLTNISKAAEVYADEGTGFYAQKSTLGYTLEGIKFYAHDPSILQPAGSVAIYRFYNQSTGDHFYTSNNKIYANYTSEGVAFYAYADQASSPQTTVPAYRFYNTLNGDHFYTISESEKNSLLNNPQWGYKYEGVGFYVFTANQDGTAPSDTVPIYRFYNSSNSDHFYTASESEKNKINISIVYRFYNPTNGDHFYTTVNRTYSGYISEGIAFYAYSIQIPNSIPIYRFYNQSTGDHFYTSNNKTYTNYTSEGVAFYAFNTQLSGTFPVYRMYNTTTGDHFYTISLNEKVRAITPALGPDISVGLWSYGKTDIMNSPFQIDANKTYNVKDVNGNILAQVDGSTTTSVSYNDNQNQLTVTVGSLNKVLAGTAVSFDAADSDNTNIVFNTHRSNYTSDWRGTIDRYRGKIKVQYYRGPDIINNSSTVATQIWVINTLPLEQYTWGAAELYGTGDLNHSKVMVTAFRSFGFRRVQPSASVYPPDYGFRMLSNSSDQNYGGYDWETNWPNVKRAAQETRSITVTYGGSTVVTPYSSWSAGNSRTYGSSRPWCSSKPDPYGNYNDDYWNNSPKKDQATLISEGNHMYGLIAKGSQRLAAVYGWDWQSILKYYYTGIGLTTNY